MQLSHFSILAYSIQFCEEYKGESIIIHIAIAFVFLLPALSFSHAALVVVSFLSLLHRFEVARSVPLSWP